MTINHNMQTIYVLVYIDYLSNYNVNIYNTKQFNYTHYTCPLYPSLIQQEWVGGFLRCVQCHGKAPTEVSSPPRDACDSTE